MKRWAIALCCLLLVFQAVSGFCQPTDVRIIYVNDFHGFAEPYKPLGSKEMLGGIAYLAGDVKRLRGQCPSLLLSAGDMIQGSNWANLFQGRDVFELMNAMRFDAMALGNHEFDYGPQVLGQRIAQAQFPVLGANVEGLAQIKPYLIKTLQGVRIAIIGVVTPDTPVTTHPRNVAGLKFIPPAAAVRHYLQELQGQADIFLVLSHIGYQEDRTLAETVPGIDVIVGGHSHTKLLEPAVVGKTIIVQAWEHAKALGVLNLQIERGKITHYDGYLQEIRPEAGKADPQIQKIVALYSGKVNAWLNRTVGETAVDLDGQNVRTRETNLGDLLADIMRQAAGADAAIINGGGIRTSITQGKITVKDVYAVLPFDNYLVAIRLTGQQIKATLEHGVSSLEEPSGRFPQVSGLAFTYDSQASVGSRVKEVLLNGKPLELDRDYVVATNDFLAAGGDGYKTFGEALRAGGDFSDLGGTIKSQNLVYNDPGTWLRDLVIAHLQAQKQINPQAEGRIRKVP